MISINQVKELSDQIEIALRESQVSLLENYPIESFIDSFTKNDELSGYLFFNESSRNIQNAVKNNYPAQAVDYHRLFLLRFMYKSIIQLDTKEFPESIRNYFLKHFERTFKRLESQIVNIEWFDFNQDKFAKEFSVVRMNMIPVGPQFIALNKLTPWVLRRHGLLAALKGAYGVFCSRGGNPIYELHTNHIDPVLMSYFNKKGWHQMFLDIANLMETNSSLKALFGAAWFFDPVLNEISPEIAYINQFVTQAGAIFIKGKTRKSDISDALFMNASRKKLHEAGKYNPQLYLVIIPRQRLIQWSKQQKQL